MTLYLKYRPQDFDSLVGQDFIRDTLKIAVAENKTVGAYMFTGPRGTGKTSTARIFAKAINCKKPTAGNPDNTCENCSATNTGSLIDIIEIDAASHTGVDNIRDIIERAQFRPTHTHYKVYIIDEVHMLSKGAFNALLKILEEPPEHVKFILATTDIYKVPDTILSRCQRYDFSSISDTDILHRLQYIATQEGVDVDEKSYTYIIKNAQGGLRNAISLFEQLIDAGKISYANIIEKLGIADDEQKDAFLEKLIQKDIHVLDDVGDIHTQGKNIQQFLRDITYMLQQRIITELQLGKKVGENIRILEILHDTLEKSKQSFDIFLTFQMGVMKILGDTPRSGNTSKKNTQKTSGDIVSESKPEKEKKEEKEQETKEHVSEDILEQAEQLFDTPSTQNTADNDTFDRKTLVQTLKQLGAAGSLTDTLKNSHITLESTKLIIHTDSQIKRNSISKTEPQDMILKSLQKMGVIVDSLEII